MKKKKAITPIQKLSTTNLLADSGYVEVPIPNRVLKTIRQLFPARTKEESVHRMLQSAIQLNQETLYN